MPDTAITYRRTIQLLSFLGLEPEKAIPILRAQNPSRSVDGLHTSALEQLVPVENQRKALLEIYAIEKEKDILKGDQQQVSALFALETTLLQKREQWLSRPIRTLMDQTFVVNPNIKTYESDRNWDIDPKGNAAVHFQAILESGEGDYYFALIKTGSYDSILQSNVLEIPLSEYQNFLLYHFERPITIGSAMHFFKEQFSPETTDEAQQLDTLTDLLLQALLFHMLIVGT
ncbi:hypothetical protein [Maribacter sp. 2-571]|uniref:hypothetical protein n=1 Tax=Maribacter sp. 2-571 TaxID=3417569 RepID=UPI003D32F06B